MEISSARVFTSGDSVESFCFDPIHHRLILTSHFGQIKMYEVKVGMLVDLWIEELDDAIPRATLFVDKGNSVIVYGLETGIAWVFKLIFRDATSLTHIQNMSWFADCCREIFQKFEVTDVNGPSFLSTKGLDWWFIVVTLASVRYMETSWSTTWPTASTSTACPVLCLWNPLWFLQPKKSRRRVFLAKMDMQSSPVVITEKYMCSRWIKRNSRKG